MQIIYEAQKSATYLPIILNPLLRGNNYVQFCNALGVCEQKVRALEEEEEFPISLMVCFCFSCVYANAFIQPHNSPLREKYYLYVGLKILLTGLKILFLSSILDNETFCFDFKLKSLKTLFVRIHFRIISIKKLSFCIFIQI